MRTILLLAALGVGVAAAPPPTDKATCDSKPFTLNKPAPKAKKPVDKPKLAETTPAEPAKAKPAPKPKTKAELIGECKDRPKKKPS
ncbi:MAG TPA: hypothetical protein VFM42_04320 [Sphingomicrobium sp.]|jgi:hypothetical protein|nr:hypothetical protein [Sphingomicrobium sp.]